MSRPVTVMLDSRVPVVQLVGALAHAGLRLKADRDGLTITFSEEYCREGKTASGYVPPLLRYEHRATVTRLPAPKVPW